MKLKDRIAIISKGNRNKLQELYGEMNTDEMERIVNGHLKVCLENIEEDLEMEKRVPNCEGCEYVKCYDYVYRNYYCDHEERESDMGKISVDHLPATSPVWCPKRAGKWKEEPINKEYTIPAIKKMIKNILLNDKEITDILIGSDVEVYKSGQDLFGCVIYDYLNNDNQCVKRRIEYDINENRFYTNKYQVLISVKMSHDFIHKDKSDINYLDLLADKIISNLVSEFGEGIKERLINQFVMAAGEINRRDIIIYL